jgi:hypothetical protein
VERRVSFVAFDHLPVEGDDRGRREALMQFVAGAGGVLFSESFSTEGAVVFMKTHELRIQAAESGRKTLLLGN